MVYAPCEVSLPLSVQLGKTTNKFLSPSPGRVTSSTVHVTSDATCFNRRLFAVYSPPSVLCPPLPSLSLPSLLRYLYIIVIDVGDSVAIFASTSRGYSW